MLKINISAQQTANSEVQEALINLLHILHSETLSVNDVPKNLFKHHNSLSRPSVANVKISVQEVDSWLNSLNPIQQNFVQALRKHKTLSLEDSARVLGIEPSEKNFKKHINGTVGSIIRWSKKHYFTYTYNRSLSFNDLSLVKLLPPWYCEQGSYHWDPQPDS
ncbi:MAG: hypothetical protein CMH49_05545 [Myxococcales bacterium]|nr:hypothetical protein [Myxococcales bacterium]